jgi:hypothetical protein
MIVVGMILLALIFAVAMFAAVARVYKWSSEMRCHQEMMESVSLD